MSQNLDALKATIADLETTIDKNDALLTTLTTAVTNGNATVTTLQGKLNDALAAAEAAGQDTAALEAINTDLAAHAATLKAAVEAATPAQ